MDIMSKFNLPSYLKGKSFSDASAIIAKKFEGRNSPEDTATLNELQGRLKDAQEFVKAEQEAKSRPQHQMPDGSVMPGEQHQGGPGQMPPGGPQDGPQIDPAALQSMMQSMGQQPQQPQQPQGQNEFATGGMMGSPGMWNGVFDSINQLTSKENQYRDRPKMNSRNPIEATNLDSYGIEGGSAADIANTELDKGVDLSAGSGFASRFGNMDTGIGFESTLGKGKPDTFGGVGNNTFGGKYNPSSSNFESLGANLGKSTFSGNDTNDKKKQSKFNPGELLRYAAPATTAYQLATLKKPEDVSLDRSNRKYNEQYVDERGIQNTTANSAANTRAGIMNASGGSAAAARANLLASQVQEQTAQSQAYNAATAENRNENRQGQQFDAGIDQLNIQQSNSENQMNLARQAGYESNKSKLLAQLGSDFSGIGQEELFKRFPELAGLGYDYRGKKIKTTP